MCKFSKNDAGAIAVEFAFVAPILVALIFGGTEFGLMFYTYSATESATNDVARQLASNRITKDQAQAAIIPRLPIWAQATASVTISTTSTVPSSNLYTIITSMPMKDATPTGFFKQIYGTNSIKVKSVMQQEPTS